MQCSRAGHEAVHLILGLLDEEPVAVGAHPRGQRIEAAAAPPARVDVVGAALERLKVKGL